MKSPESSIYRPAWPAGTRVRLIRKDHPDSMQAASVIAPLPNPSQRQLAQWYDVRFDSGRYGRFLERYLEPVESVPEAKAG